ncbi:deoxyribose-phosphate aldolase [Arenimonas alkanexedens]
MSADFSSRRTLAARLLPLLDLTSLGEDDSPRQIAALCASAQTTHGVPAAICVYPEHVVAASRAMEGTSIKVATVVNFPDGGSDPRRVALETRRAIAAGADEIDMVFPYRAFLRGDISLARDAVDAGRAACKSDVKLKLILETGELASEDSIRQVCALGIEAGVDFLKTSTGKAAINATPAAAAWMLDSIAAASGRCGFKAAGGIRTLDDAATYLTLAESRLGAEWVRSTRFRIGASSLFAEIIAALAAPE